MTKKDIYKLAKILCIAQNPREFRTLKCVGMIRDHANSRYGFVFEPPNYIAKITVSCPNPLLICLLSWLICTQDYPLQARKPISLSNLIEIAGNSQDARVILDLGIRFRIAKNIVHGIYVMHAVGWVHKNIRSDSGKFTTLLYFCKILPTSSHYWSRIPIPLPVRFKNSFSANFSSRP